jgi:galactose-1-phosphate uridylyltransferase/GNAT superfamily N-acetyltransferase
MVPTSTGRLDFQGYTPGTIGRITEAHAVYYHEHWGFDASFETQVARELSKFVSEYQADRDGLWVAVSDGRLAGSVAIDGHPADTEGARLRWFIVVPAHQGSGIGRALIHQAVAFCQRKRYRSIFLWTFEGLTRARRLYEEIGFRLVYEHAVRQWGQPITEQKFVLNLQTPGGIMEFKAQKKETVVLNPAKEMARRSIPSEIRQDPLTGRTARICHFMKLQWEKPDFEKIVAGTEKTCPFCAERVMQVTPCFPPEIVPEGRMTAEDMVLFPNIAPYDSLGAVATMGSRHYLPMTEIEPQRITKAFQLAMAFFRRIEALGHPESVYHLINWNYMPPSGSSLIHTHLQVFTTSSAPNLMREELAAAKTYLERNQSNYWDDLVAHDQKAGERYLGRIGRTDWLLSYAPLGVAGDVLAVVEGVNGTLGLTDQDLADIAVGLSRLMAAYDKMGIFSFNMNFFTGRMSDSFSRFHLLFSPRTFFNQSLGTPDIGALRNLFNETLCMAFPEDITRMLKPEFE